MKKLLIFYIITVLFISANKICAQEVKKLTFEEVIQISEEQSPQALMAKHRYRSSYWQFRSYQAQFRPSLTLTGTTPDYSIAYDKQYSYIDSAYHYVSSNTMSNLGSLALTQSIGLTGTTIALQSDLTLFNDFAANARDPRKYITSPISIGITQPIRKYNTLKWQKKTEPLRFNAAKNAQWTPPSWRPVSHCIQMAYDIGDLH